MKKGLGRIPKSLSWIDQVQEETVIPAEKIKSENKDREKKLASKKSVKRDEQILVVEEKSTQQGLPTGWSRATYIVAEELNKKLKALAYWERLTVKEIMHEALTCYLNGKNIKPIPKKKGL